MNVFKSKSFLLGLCIFSFGLEVFSSILELMYGTSHDWLFGVGSVFVAIALTMHSYLKQDWGKSIYFKLFAFLIIAVALHIVVLVIRLS